MSKKKKKKVYVVMADVNNMQHYEDFSYIIFPLHSFTKKENAIDFIKSYDKFVDWEHILGYASCGTDVIPFEEQALRDIETDVFNHESVTRAVIGNVKRRKTEQGTDRIVSGTRYRLYVVKIKLN